MKLLFLLLVLLGDILAAGGGPPASRVALGVLTKAAYAAALKQQVRTKPPVTYPLKKQGGRLSIPTTAGPRVFRDRGVGTDDIEQAQYEYAGYWPQFGQHVVVAHLWEHTDYLLIAPNGKQLVLPAEPQFGPGLQRFVVASAGIEYAVLPNVVQLYQWQNGGFAKVWETTPETWEPEQVAWTTANTLVLRKRTLTNTGADYGYARLTIR